MLEMENINIRLAELDDSDDLVEFLHSRSHESLSRKCEPYTKLSIKSFLVNNSSQIFLAESDGKLRGAVLTAVVDAGTTLVFKDVHVEVALKDSELSNALINAVYKYMGKTFLRLKRQRFVSSSSGNFAELFHKNQTSNRSIEKFSKVFELDQLELEIPKSENLGRKFDSLVRKSGLVHMTRREADLYILRNLSCLSAQTLIVDSVPYIAQLSNADSIFTSSEYLMGEQQSDQRDLNSNSSLKVPSPNSKGRNSPTRLHSSHMVNILESLHSNLQNMTGGLANLRSSLQDALPKSFSHGKQLNIQKQNIWEFTIYSEDSGIFRAHVLEQLRAASVHMKTTFRLTMNYNCAMATEARKLFAEELGLEIINHERNTLTVYERPCEL